MSEYIHDPYAVIARRAANRIVEEHRGAWGGLLLQVDSLLVPIIREAMDSAIKERMDSHDWLGEDQ